MSNSASKGIQPPFNKSDLKQKARKLDLLLLDVDGVFTSGGIILAGDELEAKRFDVQDGMGITLAQDAGIEVGIITGRVSDAVRRRAKKLDIDKVYQGHFWKEEALDEILTERSLELSNMAFMGDDVLDIPVLRKVGLPFAPANAIPEVKSESVYVCENEGGNGAIREAVDFLLELQNKKTELYDYYATGGE